MNKKTKTQTFFCKRCGTFETIPEGLDNIKLEQITKVICPRCSAKGHDYKMYKVIDEKNNLSLLKGGKIR